MNLRELMEQLEPLHRGYQDLDDVKVMVTVDGDWWAPLESVGFEDDTIWLTISIYRAKS